MSFLDSTMLFPLSTIYSAVTRARLQAYRSGLLSTSKLPVPVISVGNLTTGGTGKTPLVEWISRRIVDDGKRVCVLTRGYGRINPKTQVVVSNGTEILTNERAAGDEPFLLAENLRGIAAVVCNSNRAAAGQWAIQNLGTQVFVLDDGFQHLRLARDLNIVTIDATEPWGGGRLLPQGRLREPRTSLARADCVVITRVDQTADLDSLRDAVTEVADGIPVFMSRMLTSGLFTLAGEPVVFPLQPTGAFCGVGNAESFFNHLRGAGQELAFTRAFADHHQYKQTELDALAREATAHGAVSLITTAKDAIKLRSLSLPIPCCVLEIRISIEDEERFVELIRNAISQAGSTNRKPDR
ncbi:MAG: tetraacyldisaccharide 4'-kinase [Pyrinomonadaceae bacterium]|nr:tetraacyldisaccharide 4'-kinase [Pyrinomonadaceae bacterium]